MLFYVPTLYEGFAMNVRDISLATAKFCCHCSDRYRIRKTWQNRYGKYIMHLFVIYMALMMRNVLIHCHPCPDSRPRLSVSMNIDNSQK